ncbi:MAG: AsmA-like C-terminal domain-containing protein [Phycisphaerae bacterium]|nr:AsmA-like C-terminal domain-containing protein [Phycisphaerae bacterium]
MVGPIPTTARRRRLRWRRFIERQTLTRHPVSLTRQRIGKALLIALMVGFVWYAVTTRDEAIRQRAIAFLTEATSGEVQVERATFKMFGGITLHNVRVSVPYSEELDPGAVDTASREIFSAASVKLLHNPWRLLIGSLRVEHIIATKPRIVLAHNVDTGLRNWQLLASDTGPSRARKPGYRPNVTLRSAMAEVVSIHADGRHETCTEELDADARPHRQMTTAFLIEVRRFSEPAERTTVIFDPGARLVTNTPFVDAQTVRLQLPKAAQEFFDRIALQGEVKLSRLIYDAQSPEDIDTSIELRNVRCTVPASMLASGAAGDATNDASSDVASGTESYLARRQDTVLTMTNLTGRLDLRGSRLGVDISGLINGAECRVRGCLANVDNELDQMGIDLRIQGTKMPAPEGSMRQELLTDPSVPHDLQKFFQDYDPHGNFDVDFQFFRPPGPAERVCVSGTLRPQGATGRCRWFAYAVEDLHGLVRFESEHVRIENIQGKHGPAHVQVNGRIDRTTRRAAVDVNIAATDVPLDTELFEPLSDRYKSIWRRFAPRGRADITVHVQRPGAGADEPQPTYETHVAADLVDARICFNEYPYPLDNVRGRLEIKDDRIQFTNLTGHREGASVQINGRATMGDSDNPEVELHIGAKSMRLDDTLASALPADGRAVFAQFQPEGFVDLSGTVSLNDPQRGLVYDLRAKLHDATLCYQHFPYSIRGLSADVEIRPDDISVLSVTGGHGAANLAASGKVRRLSEGFVADLAFDCAQLALDQELYESLPEPLRDVWRLLKPAGSVQVHTMLHLVSEGGQQSQRHRTEIETTDGSICFRGFPLPLSSVSAHVLVADRRVEILSLHGRAGTGAIELSGEIDMTAPGRRGVLTLDAKGMTFSKELIAAMPGALRQWMESINPTGQFDLRLDRLQFDVDCEDKTRWEFAGELRLADARGDLGFDLRHVTGTVTGRGTVRRDHGVELDARGELARVVLAGWHLENLVAHIIAGQDNHKVMVEDVVADAYGGEAGGFAEIEFGLGRTSYQLSAAVRDAQLSRYLAVHRSTKSEASGNEDKPTAQGSIYGNLILRGQAGRNAHREGTGEVFIRESQIARLPIMLAIFQVLNLTPDENAFHDGWLKYSLCGDRLTFQQIDLQGKAMSFVGGGHMDLRTKQLDLTLLAGSSVRIRVPFLTDILEGASRELMEVRVTGNLENPQITPQPLRSLTEAMKTLFPEPPRQSGQRPESWAHP